MLRKHANVYAEIKHAKANAQKHANVYAQKTY
jgi:hypothetical protein